MPVEERVGGLLAGVFRFLASLFTDLVIEVAIQGTGYLLLRLLRPRSEPSEAAATLAGLCVWAILIGSALRLWHAQSA